MVWTRPHVSDSLYSRLNADQASLLDASHPVGLADGRSLRVIDTGHGDAIVLLPMITELNFVYAPQITEFQVDHRVVLYEPELSADARVGIADRAQEARALLAALRIDRAHFIVWGDTGAAAYHLAKHHPEVCRSIVFIGLADRYCFPQPYGLLLKLLEHFPIERTISSRTFAKLLGRFVGGTQIRPEWIVEKAEVVPRLSALFKRSILPNLTEHRPGKDEVRVPCLLISGDNDRIVSTEQTERMAELLPYAEPPIIKTGGEHFVSYVDCDEVNPAIRRFVTSIS
jgi:pimeloyl-ACP methyl ester carboxylesterase